MPAPVLPQETDGRMIKCAGVVPQMWGRLGYATAVALASQAMRNRDAADADNSGYIARQIRDAEAFDHIMRIRQSMRPRRVPMLLHSNALIPQGPGAVTDAIGIHEMSGDYVPLGYDEGMVRMASAIGRDLAKTAGLAPLSALGSAMKGAKTVGKLMPAAGGVTQKSMNVVGKSLGQVAGSSAKVVGATGASPNVTSVMMNSAAKAPKVTQAGTLKGPQLGVPSTSTAGTKGLPTTGVEQVQTKLPTTNSIGKAQTMPGQGTPPVQPPVQPPAGTVRADQQRTFTDSQQTTGQSTQMGKAWDRLKGIYASGNMGRAALGVGAVGLAGAGIYGAARGAGSLMAAPAHSGPMQYGSGSPATPYAVGPYGEPTYG